MFCPTLENECRLDLEADSIVIAIGQKLKSEGVPEALTQGGKSLAATSPTFQSPANQKVFCCGDAVSGASFVVNATGQGREAAKSIDRFVAGDGLGWGRDFWVDNGYVKDYEALSERAQGGIRQALNGIPVEKRTLDQEIEMPFTPHPLHPILPAREEWLNSTVEYKALGYSMCKGPNSDRDFAFFFGRMIRPFSRMRNQYRSATLYRSWLRVYG